MLDALLKAIKSNELDVKDRFGLASDLLALTECGRIPAFQFLAFFAQLTNEDEYIIWQVVIGGRGGEFGICIELLFRRLEILHSVGSLRSRLKSQV